MKSNTIRLYKEALELIENPKGADAAERNLCKEQALKRKTDLEEHFKNSKKYRDDAEIKALVENKEVVEKEKKKGVKNAKK